ncbi:MAG: vitamin-B12 independent methionine synthase, partial [Chloroflexota bacterium]
ILREEVLELKAAGVDFIQFDEPVITDVVFRPERKERTFMCASMAATTGDPDEEIYKASWLLNQVMRDIDGIETGVHVCRGNWSRQEGALLSGGYGPLMGYMMDIPVDQLVLEYATPRAGDLDAFAGHAKQKEIGLGVVNPRSDEIESPQYVVGRVEDALKYFDPKQIYLNPDCGFGTFAERPMNPADIAGQKLGVISQAAAILRKKYA